MNTKDEVEWNNVYSLGIDKIDFQHKKLFAIVNRLFALKSSHNETEKIKEILYEFSDYMRTHFDDEESYMKSIGYPNLKEHVGLHQELVDRLASVINTPAKIDIIKTKMRVIAKQALVNHIVREDTKIMAYRLSKDFDKSLDFAETN